MRVALDVTPAVNGVTGVARHATSLCDHLVRQEVDVRPFAIGRGSGVPPVGTRRMRVPLRVIQACWSAGVPLRAELLSGRADLVHSIDLVIPPTRLPVIATMHDVAALERPELHTARTLRQTSIRLAQLADADAIIAVSSATADVLVDFGVASDRITVIPNAPYPLPDPPASAPAEGQPFLLAVGQVNARKDYATMFRAFAASGLSDHRLIVAGAIGFGSEEALEVARESQLGDRLVLAGHVSDAELSRLYGTASALCLTSRQEGFGIPLVEAMQRDLPIVASDLEAVREVAGDAAVLVPAGDVKGFAAAMTAVVSDAQLRDRITTAGRARHHRFTWEQVARDTIAVYRRVLGED